MKTLGFRRLRLPLLIALAASLEARVVSAQFGPACAPVDFAGNINFPSFLVVAGGSVQVGACALPPRPLGAAPIDVVVRAGMPETDALKQALPAAAAAWNQACSGSPLPSLQFRSEPDPSSGRQIEVVVIDYVHGPGFGIDPAPPFPLPWGEFARFNTAGPDNCGAFSPWFAGPAGAQEYRGGVLLLGRFKGDGSPCDLSSLRHELGHGLGLGHGNPAGCSGRVMGSFPHGDPVAQDCHAGSWVFGGGVPLSGTVADSKPAFVVDLTLSAAVSCQAPTADQTASVATGESFSMRVPWNANWTLTPTADNGLLLGEHSLFYRKHAAYEPSIQVPLLVRGPRSPKGKIRSELVANIDLAPTLVELAGAADAEAFDGRSMAKLWRGQRVGEWREDLLIELFDKPVAGTPPPYQALRGEDFLYVRYDGGLCEYFDTAVDPHQLDNRCSALSPERRAELEARLDRLQTCQGSSCW